MNRILFPGAKAGLLGFAVTALIMVTIDFVPGNPSALDPVAQYDLRVKAAK